MTRPLSASSRADCDGSSVNCTTSSTKFDSPTPIKRTGRFTASRSRVSSESAASKIASSLAIGCPGVRLRETVVKSS